MNKKYYFRLFMATAAVVAAGSLSSCSDDDNDDWKDVAIDPSEMSLTYGTDAAWDKTYTDDLLNIKGFVFSHTGSSTPWMVYDGFTAANSNDHKEYSDMLAHQFDVIAEGRAPYFIAYWNTMEDNSTLLSKRSCLVYYMEEANDHEEFYPKYVDVTNTSYAYYTMLNGNNYCRKFQKGDYLKLIAHGVKENGQEVTLDFYLANITTDNVAEGLVKEWTKWDLTPLGEVDYLYFTMDSSDKGQFGINTPTYFAMSRMEARVDKH